MSNYTIRLTPSELRKRADEIEQNAKIVQKEVDNISNEVQGLRPTFMGATASKFLTEFDRSRSDMEQWDDIVKQFANLLRMAANNLEKADRQGM
jgi:WXG100 family type VII secretion target